jgi:hypothetical protein
MTDITLKELISLAQPYELTISTRSLKNLPAITFELTKDDLHVAEMIHLDDLDRSDLVKYIFESMQYRLEKVIKEKKYESMPYKPVCPRGYDDCVRDPAYIKHHYPDWYEELYHDLPPEKAIYIHNGCYDHMQEDPNEEHYCYDDEDK